jgi:hypothetical protein
MFQNPGVPPRHFRQLGAHVVILILHNVFILFFLKYLNLKQLCHENFNFNVWVLAGGGKAGVPLWHPFTLKFLFMKKIFGFLGRRWYSAPAAGVVSSKHDN